jgi:hypothetical protein
LLPEGHLGVTVPSVEPSGQVLQVYGDRVIVISNATRVHDLRLERSWISDRLEGTHAAGRTGL